MDGRRVVRGIGKTFIGAGVVILLFVAYQLWGTGLAEAKSQRQLKDQFSAQAITPTTSPATPVETTTSVAPLPAPPTGAAVAIITIPKIGVNKAVVEGVGVPDLKKGPGHYPGTPLPGQPGNAAIAGHRTTYGAPFYNLDGLKPGDKILVTTRTGSHFEYDVSELRVVKPSDTSVVQPTTDNRLTLTTCNPRYSASQRLVVSAILKGEVTDPPTAPPAAGPTTPEAPTGVGTALPIVSDAGLGGERSARIPAVLWGLAVFLAGLAVAVIAHRWRGWRRWLTYAVCAAPMLVLLFNWFQQVNLLLPSNI